MTDSIHELFSVVLSFLSLLSFFLSSSWFVERIFKCLDELYTVCFCLRKNIVSAA